MIFVHSFVFLCTTIGCLWTALVGVREWRHDSVSGFVVITVTSSAWLYTLARFLEHVR